MSEHNDAATKLVRYEQARTALAEAHRVDEVKAIRDKAQALAAYARQAKDNELIGWATEIKVRAERRAGEMLAQVERAQAGRPAKNSFHDGTNYQQALKENGVAKVTAHRWQQLAAIPEEQFERSVNATKEVMGEVTTASLLSQAKKKKRAVSRMADDNTPVVIPPDKPKAPRIKVYEVWAAIETLAHTDIKPERLQSLMERFSVGSTLMRTWSRRCVF